MITRRRRSGRRRLRLEPLTRARHRTPSSLSSTIPRSTASRAASRVPEPSSKPGSPPSNPAAHRTERSRGATGSSWSSRPVRWPAPSRPPSRAMIASLAWVIGAAFQGHGYAKEAAAAMAAWLTDQGVTRFRATIHPDHAASGSVADRWGCSPPTSSSTAKSCGVRPGHRPPTPPPRDNPRASGAQVAPLRGRLTARHGPLEPGMEVRFLPPEPRSSAAGSVPRDVRGWPPDGAGRRHRGLLLQGGGP